MRRLTARFGLRGSWLIVLGALWIVFGTAMLLDPERRIPLAAHQYLPYEARAGAWMATGAAALWFGLRRSPEDGWGHVALVLMPLTRALGFAFSWLMYLGSSMFGAVPPLGYSEAWYSTAIWSLLLVVLRLGAAWPEPPHHLPRPPEDVTIGDDQ